MLAIPPANSTKTFVLRMFRLQSFFAFNNTRLNFYVDMQQCVFLFLGLTESNNSSVNEITFRNKLIPPAMLTSNRLWYAGSTWWWNVHTSTSPEKTFSRATIALQQWSLTTVTPELLSLRHSLTCNAWEALSVTLLFFRVTREPRIS